MKRAKSRSRAATTRRAKPAHAKRPASGKSAPSSRVASRGPARSNRAADGKAPLPSSATPFPGASSHRRLRVLVTAGPTREHVDPVRYLTNESSGRMGFAIAEAAARAGHAVTLIAGPVHLSTPKGVRRIDVVSARELLDACRREFRRCDALVMAAAVADWRPARKLAAKWRAKDGGTERTTLELVRNPDVLATLTRGRRTAGKTVIAFALETGSGVARARRKLAKKGADWIVLNGPSSLGGERTSVLLFGTDGARVELLDRSKAEVARALVRLVEGRMRPAAR